MKRGYKEKVKEVLKMAKHQKVQEWHTCDVCCEQCEPVGTIEIPFAYSMDLVYTMQVRVSAYLPYGTANGDVCFNCFKKHIQKWIADQERKQKVGVNITDR